MALVRCARFVLCPPRGCDGETFGRAQHIATRSSPRPRRPPPELTMSMGSPPPRSVSLPKLGKLERKVTSGLILSDSELRVLRKQAPLLAVS